MAALLLNLSTTPIVTWPAIFIMAASIRIRASAPCLLLLPNLCQVSIGFFPENTRRFVSYIGKKCFKYTKRAPLPACPSGYTYYDTTCDDGGYVKGCLSEEPCGQLDNNDPLSVVPTIRAPQLT